MQRAREGPQWMDYTVSLQEGPMGFDPTSHFLWDHLSWQLHYGALLLVTCSYFTRSSANLRDFTFLRRRWRPRSHQMTESLLWKWIITVADPVCLDPNVNLTKIQVRAKCEPNKTPPAEGYLPWTAHHFHRPAPGCIRPRRWWRVVAVSMTTWRCCSECSIPPAEASEQLGLRRGRTRPDDSPLRYERMTHTRRLDVIQHLSESTEYMDS